MYVICMLMQFIFNLSFINGTLTPGDVFDNKIKVFTDMYV